MEISAALLERCPLGLVALAGLYVFTCESSYCFQHVLAIAILSVCPSVCPSVRHTGGSVKTVQARIAKSSLSAAWKTLVSGTVKLFHKFEGGHPEQGR